MTRVKTGIITKKKHKRILKQAKGYWMTRHKQFKKAQEAMLHAGAYAYHGRKLKKRDFRQLWIQRINAFCQSFGLKYSQFIHKLKEKKINLDRKILAQIAVEHPKVFEKIISEIK